MRVRHGTAALALWLFLSPGVAVAADVQLDHYQPFMRHGRLALGAGSPLPVDLPAYLHTYTPSTTEDDDLPPLCPADFYLQFPAACPDAGPGHYAGQLVAAGLPYPPPAVPISPTLPYRGLTPDAYARILTDTAEVYRSPYDAVAGLDPVREFEMGFEFVSILGRVTVDGEAFYQINAGEYMRAEALQEVRPSSFQGVHLAEPPPHPIGWMINTVQVSAAPGQPPATDAPFAGRYAPISVLGVQRAGDWNWYQIAPGQWVEQRNTAIVYPAPPGGGGTLIAVDTYEQTLGVYVDGRLIFATLVSSGSRYFPTRQGTFQVWARLLHGKMSGAYFEDRRDYYFLEDVPWILYYDGDRALHGAYWHDNFGVRSSHGCVNLAPRDARWLYDFARVGATVVVFSSGG